MPIYSRRGILTGKLYKDQVWRKPGTNLNTAKPLVSLTQEELLAIVKEAIAEALKDCHKLFIPSTVPPLDPIPQKTKPKEKKKVIALEEPIFIAPPTKDSSEIKKESIATNLDNTAIEDIKKILGDK